MLNLADFDLKKHVIICLQLNSEVGYKGATQRCSIEIQWFGSTNFYTSTHENKIFRGPGK
jgi:hypothetical protein